MVIQSVEKLSEEVATLALQLDLRARNFAASLERKPTTSLTKTMKRVYQEMVVEEMFEGKFKKARTQTTPTTKQIAIPKVTKRIVAKEQVGLENIDNMPKKISKKYSWP